MTRIVVHAGFHKTGTTSTQNFLRENRAALSEHVQILLKADMVDLTEAARRYSIKRTAQRQAALEQAATQTFEALDRHDRRAILLASEDLSGHMPGRRGVTQYDAAPVCLRSVQRAIGARFGNVAQVIFVLSTRAPDPWLRSTWWQTLRSTRLTKDFETYAAGLPAAADHAATLREITQAVFPAQVRAFSLEDARAMSLGPVTPLLDFLDVTGAQRQNLCPVPVANRQPGNGLAEVFLALNRSGLSDAALRQAKRNLLQIANKESQAR
ncbi:hypothetical protein [Cognatishimia sp. F0-27]|uniref:hypothetical protein n=1 Tax=Cognatishimia sp. F0-27 TaxID=2816855 RepID=UPI001D0CCB42|nr:hypothetical protein [Cognatishimia sp. F0-27]MCC1494281.1 hypothetical protein [Cognatishimia sp. F0-27]